MLLYFENAKRAKNICAFDGARKEYSFPFSLSPFNFAANLKISFLRSSVGFTTLPFTTRAYRLLHSRHYGGIQTTVLEIRGFSYPFNLIEQSFSKINLIRYLIDTQKQHKRCLNNMPINTSIQRR